MMKRSYDATEPEPNTPKAVAQQLEAALKSAHHLSKNAVTRSVEQANALEFLREKIWDFRAQLCDLCEQRKWKKECDAYDDLFRRATEFLDPRR